MSLLGADYVVSRNEKVHPDRRDSDLPDSSSISLSADEDAFTSMRTADLSKRRNTSLVSYTAFKNQYWPHFPQYLTKGLGMCFVDNSALLESNVFGDPALVFSEFMG